MTEGKHMMELIKGLVAAATLLTAAMPGSVWAQNNGGVETETHLIIRFEAEPAKLAEFSAIMMSVEDDMQTEPGFVSALVYQNADDPSVFTLIEKWESRKAHEDHFDRIVASGAWEHILGLLRRDPQLGYFAEL